MDIGEVLRRAWEIIWKNKALWIFGILASCSNAGGGGGGNSGFQSSNSEFGREFGNAFNKLQDWEIALIVGAVILFILVIVVLFTFLGTIGRIGLIQGTLEAEAGGSRLSFGEVFSLSTPFFWRVFGLNLLVGLAIFAIFLIAAIPAILFSVLTLGLGIICLVCVFIPLSGLIQILLEQANIALVVENLGILDALRRGWDVFRDNLGTMIIMGLILVIGAGVVSLLFAAPLITVVFPAATGLIIDTEASIAGGIGLALLCLVAYLPVLIVLGGILRAYVGSAWTLTYLRLSGRDPALIEA